MSQSFRLPSEKVFKPNACDLVTSGTKEQREERLAHSSGKFDVSGIDLESFAAQEGVERAPTPLVRLEERDVAQHFGRFVAVRQNDLSIRP
jgi:hypothetical protein